MDVLWFITVKAVEKEFVGSPNIFDPWHPWSSVPTYLFNRLSQYHVIAAAVQIGILLQRLSTLDARARLGRRVGRRSQDNSSLRGWHAHRRRIRSDFLRSFAFG